MVSGYCDEKFSSARELFENNLNSGFERGAAITVEIEGETVVDLWGGIDSEEQNTTWQEDTIVNVFSSTKGLADVCLLQWIAEGRVNLDDPVANYWPEFAQEGNDKIPVSYLFCHKSGLCGVTKPLVVEKTLTIVSSCQVVFSFSESVPPQRSTTVSPSISTVMAAPLSKPEIRLFSNNSLAEENFSSQYPLIIFSPQKR